MKKEIFQGVIMGIIIPLSLLCIIYSIFLFFDRQITSQVIESTILLGLGLNALYIRFLFKKDKDYSSRGVMISSFVYFFVWLYLFVI